MSLQTFLDNHVLAGLRRPENITCCRWRGMCKYIETRFKEGDTYSSILDRLYNQYY